MNPSQAFAFCRCIFLEPSFLESHACVSPGINSMSFGECTLNSKSPHIFNNLMAPFHSLNGGASLVKYWRSHLFHSPSSFRPYSFSCLLLFIYFLFLLFFSFIFLKFITSLVGCNRVVWIGSRRCWDLFLPVIRIVWLLVHWKRVGWHASFVRLQPKSVCPFADDFSCQRAELVRPIVFFGYPKW